VGCGPGYLLRELGIAVGEKGRAIGIDISAPMLAMAHQRCAGIVNVLTEKTDALKIPGADSTFDLACALQVYAYVTELDHALVELYRALKPGGRAVILDTDFSGVVWESNNRERMQEILAAWDKHVAWPDLPRILPRRLRAAGFQVEHCDVVPILTLAVEAPYSAASTATLRLMSSAASADRRSLRPSAHRYSMATFSPSIHPRSRSPSQIGAIRNRASPAPIATRG
jgi:SAM-dependent methyltransferase